MQTDTNSTGSTGADGARPAPMPFFTARLAVAVGFLALIALVYWPSSIALDAEWRDTIDKTYTHGYLVLMISLWLMWRDRAKLEAAPIEPEPLALALLVALSVAWIYFWHAVIQDPHLLLLPLMLYVALIAVLGRAAARVLAFPVAYLYFAMPVWSDLVVPLQHLSVAANGVFISITGLPAYMDGDLIRLPAGTLKIAEGCSGMHFVIVGLALAALYGEIARDSWRLRLIWLAWMGVLALVANWVRIYVIAAAAYATQMKTYLVTVDHYWFGWGVFAACFAFFLWTSERIAARLEPRRSGLDREPLALRSARPLPRWGYCVAATACLATLPILSYTTDPAHSTSDSGLALRWPTAVGWKGPARVLPSLWNPVFDHPSVQGRRTYRDPDGRSAEVYVVAFRNQRQGAKLVEWGNSMLGNGGLRVTAVRTVETPQGPWRERELVAPDRERSILLTQYRVGDRRFAWPRGSQLWYGVARFWSAPISAAVAVRVHCEHECRRAAALAVRGANELVPELRRNVAAPGRGSP